MEILHNGFTLDTPGDCFPLTTDSMLLAGIVKLERNARVLDLGSGCGTLGVLLCARNDSCTVTGVEISMDAHHAAEENIRRNSLQSRLSSVCADIRSIPQTIQAGSFDICVSNPPYFTGGFPAAGDSRTRNDATCPPDALCSAAAKALRWGGYLHLVHKPDKLAQLCTCATQAGLEPKELTLVRHTKDSPISLILLRCKKGAKPGLTVTELTLREPDGTLTAQYRKLYCMEEA